MKVFNYIILIIGLIIMFEIAGIPTGSANILTFVGIDLNTGSTTTNSNLFNSIFGTTGILIGLGVGIAVGFITKSQPENFIILPLITGSFVFFMGAFTSIIIWAQENTSIWSSTIVSLVLGVLSVGYIISLVEFFRGTD